MDFELNVFSINHGLISVAVLNTLFFVSTNTQSFGVIPVMVVVTVMGMLTVTVPVMVTVTVKTMVMVTVKVKDANGIRKSTYKHNQGEGQ